MLTRFADLASDDDAGARTLLGRVGIPEIALSDPAMLVSWTAIGDLMEALAATTGNPQLGLDWAHADIDPFLGFGPLALIARFHETLGEWCVASRDYWRFHTNAYTVDLIEPETGRDVVLRFSFNRMVPPSRQQVEFTVAGTCSMMRALADFADSDFTVVRFRHFAPDDISVHESVFRCPIEFGASHDEIVFLSALHDLPIHPPREHLERYIARYRGSVPGYDGSMRAKVEAVVPCFLGTRYCSFAFVAALFSVNPKKLQRELAKHGTNFAEIVDRARERMARQLLAGSDVPIATIAGLLGYANASPFIKAFKRWTSTSPRAYRKAALPAGTPDSVLPAPMSLDLVLNEPCT